MRYASLVHHEQALVTAFVKPAKRERYRALLSDPLLRHKFTHQLPHFRDFEHKYRLRLESDKLFRENVARELQKRHSPNIVYAISEDSMLDQQEHPLIEVLERIVGWGFGTVLSCLPGRLVFVETEDERFILERHDDRERPQYVRFIIGRKDEASHVETGIFQAVRDALDFYQITGSDARQLYELREWFNWYLEKPTSFGRGALYLGICWFKTGATEHIARIWRWSGSSNAMAFT